MPVAPLTVKLVRVDGSPVARAVVTAQRVVGGVGPEGFVPSGTDSGVTDSEGRYVFNLQTGDYTLRAVDPIGGYPIMNNLTVNLPEEGYSMEAATTQATVIDSILNTTTIVVPCFAPNGLPIAGAVITAQLSAVAQDGSTYLSGEPITFLTDSAGFAELQLVPNVGGTTYTITATDPETDEVLIPATVVTVGSADQMLQDLVAGNTNEIPSVDFDLDSSGLAPYGLSVTASAIDGDGTIASYHWAINGVTAGTSSSLSTSITTPGTHIVRLTITDDDGAIRSTARTIVLSSIPESATDGIGLMSVEEAEAGTATAPRLISAEVLAAAIAALGGAGGLTPASQAEMEAGILSSLRAMSPLLVSQAIDAQALQPEDIGSTVQAHSAVLDATTAAFTTADETKLDGVEAGAAADQSASEVPFTPTGSISSTTVQAAIAEVAAEAGGSPDASSVSVTPVGDIAATDAQAALAELDAEKLDAADIGTNVQAHSAVLDATTAAFTTADETKLDGVESGAAADQSAAEVPFTPTGSISATTVQAAIAEVAAEAGGSPDASSVSVTPVGDIAATDAQAALAELDAEKLDAADIGTNIQAHSAVLDATTAAFTTADETKLDGVESGAAADQSAAEVPFTPTGSISSTTVQAAIAEVAAEAGGSPDASSVSVTPVGDIAATDAQAALAELDAEKLDAADIGTNVQAHSAVLDATTASFTTADETKLDGVEAGAAADQSAAEVPFTPTGSISSTTVQAAIAEVAAEAGGGGSPDFPTGTDNTSRTLNNTTDMNTVHRSVITTPQTITLPDVTTVADGSRVGFYNSRTSTALLTIDCNTVQNINLGGYLNPQIPLAPGDRLELIVDDDSGEWGVTYDGIKGPFVVLTKTGATQVLTASTYEKLQWNNIVSDSHGAFDASTLYRFTAPISGNYLCFHAATVHPDSLGDAFRSSALYKNGALDSDGAYLNNFNPVGTHNDAFQADLDASGTPDYIEFFGVSQGEQGGFHATRSKLVICRKK